MGQKCHSVNFSRQDTKGGRNRNTKKEKERKEEEVVVPHHHQMSEKVIIWITLKQKQFGGKCGYQSEQGRKGPQGPPGPVINLPAPLPAPVYRPTHPNITLNSSGMEESFKCLNE